MISRYAGACAGCGETFDKGASIFYYPHGKRVLVGACADAAERDYTAACFDEDVYNAGFGV